MRVMAQIAMVMNLDKCIGCSACSVTCKQTWTNRRGVEYVWFNNVETRPGLGYPQRYADQEKWKGGWELDRRGRLKLKQGGRFRKLAEIFANPVLPTVEDYYEPWTYDYANLQQAPLGSDFPVARPRSLLTGKPMDTVRWSANWDDNLGGAPEYGPEDPVVQRMRASAAAGAAGTAGGGATDATAVGDAGPGTAGTTGVAGVAGVAGASDAAAAAVAAVGEKVKFEFEQAFMFYLPRICEHCLNPACVASCPSGALYKRVEDGIVLVDQDRCRGWRQCVTACPYKKVYFNHRTGKAEKCTFCYPRVEVGLPTVCSETCPGRLRYLGVMLYDADKVADAARTEDDRDLYEAQLGVFLDPADPAVVRAAEAAGIAHDWIEAAKRSPVYRLICEYRVALPLHPEFRTLPMVWYVPPLSPVVEAVADAGHDGEDVGNLFGAIDALRIPVEYLAELFTAGDVVPVRAALGRLAAMRAYMREVNLGERAEEPVVEIEELYRLLAIAKYEERYVIPTAAMADAHAMEEAALASGCSVDDFGASDVDTSGPFGEDSGPKNLPLVTLEDFHAMRRRQTADRHEEL